MQKSKRCKVHYRRLDRAVSICGTESLASAISNALEKPMGSGDTLRSKASHRMTSFPNATENKLLLNNIHINREEDLVFGNICLFLPGDMQAILDLVSKDEEHRSLDEVLSELSIYEMKAPEGSEYVHAITYWCAIGDHFYQIQHQALSTGPIQDYLNWMLCEKSGYLHPGNRIVLKSVFDREQMGADLGDIKEIQIGGIVPETIPQETRLAPYTEDEAKIREYTETRGLGDRIVSSFNSAKKILDDLLGPLKAQQLIDQMPSEAALEVRVSIGYRAQRRRIDKQFMRNLESGLRDLPDGQIRVKGKDGEFLGSDARLSLDMNVKRMGTSSSLLDLEDVLRQFKEVHRRFLFDGRITA
ncbi:hypothetical protein M4J39_13045 [Pleomorphomonas sp. NRKKF1]|nr:hypothetical protein [Pleomorphomonas sp. NRK KF1]